MSSPAPERQRLFFALWPDAVARDGLHTLAARHLPHGGRPVPAVKLHLTLAFIGAVDGATRVCLERAAATVAGAPFTLMLERIGHWPRPRILWAAPAVTPPALGALVAGLEAALAPCGYRPEHRPYRAHVTLARKVTGPVPVTVVEPVAWRADTFCLVESVPGGEYRVLTTWPLVGAVDES